jgi:hypothetical protein
MRFRSRLTCQNERLLYVVSIAFDPVRGQGYVYQPGRNDKNYRLNVHTMIRLVDQLGRRCRTSDRVAQAIAIPDLGQSCKST